MQLSVMQLKQETAKVLHLDCEDSLLQEAEQVYRFATLIHNSEGGRKPIIEATSIIQVITQVKSRSLDAIPIQAKLLQQMNFSKEQIMHILHASRHCRMQDDSIKVMDLETQILQDAIRLQELGIIPQARAFELGSSDKIIHLATEIRTHHTPRQQHVNSLNNKILHIYKELNTKTAKEIANDLHGDYIEFLEQRIANNPDLLRKGSASQ